VEAVLEACRSGNFDYANKSVNNFIAEGYPASQMLTQVFICLFLFHWPVSLRFLLFYLFESCFFYFSSYLKPLLKKMIYQMNRKQEYPRSWVKLIRLLKTLLELIIHNTPPFPFTFPGHDFTTFSFWYF